MDKFNLANFNIGIAKSSKNGGQYEFKIRKYRI